MAEPGPCTTEVITRLSWRWSISNRRERAQHDPAVYLATASAIPTDGPGRSQVWLSVEAPRRDSDDRNEWTTRSGSEATGRCRRQRLCALICRPSPSGHDDQVHRGANCRAPWRLERPAGAPHETAACSGSPGGYVEHRPPEAGAQVRILPGGASKSAGHRPDANGETPAQVDLDHTLPTLHRAPTVTDEG